MAQLVVEAQAMASGKALRCTSMLSTGWPLITVSITAPRPGLPTMKQVVALGHEIEPAAMVSGLAGPGVPLSSCTTLPGQKPLHRFPSMTTHAVADVQAPARRSPC